MRGRSLGRQPTMEEIAAASRASVLSRTMENGRSASPSERAVFARQGIDVDLALSQPGRSGNDQHVWYNPQGLPAISIQGGEKYPYTRPHFYPKKPPCSGAKEWDAQEKKCKCNVKCPPDLVPDSKFCLCGCHPGEECCSNSPCASPLESCSGLVGKRTCSCNPEVLPTSGQACESTCGCKSGGLSGCAGACEVKYPILQPHEPGESPCKNITWGLSQLGVVSVAECKQAAEVMTAAAVHPCLASVPAQWMMKGAKCK